MVTSLVRLGALDRSAGLDEVRARALRLAAEGQTLFGESGVCLYLYRQQTPLSTLTSRGVGLCLVLQGHKRVYLGRPVLQVEPGQMLVVTRDVELQTVVGSDEGDRPYLALGLWFDPERVARALLHLATLGAAAVDESADASPVFATTPTVDVVSGVGRLLAAVEDPVDRATIAPLVLDELMFRLLRTEAAAAVRAGIGPPQDAVRILGVMQFIRENHARKLTVTVLAKRVAMSPSHFAHTFSNVAHLSPMKYVREVRLERAKTLLGEKGARPTEVASEVGFESAAHFAREFKRRYGTPPSRYRERAMVA